MPEHSRSMRLKRLLVLASLTLFILLVAFVPAARAQRVMSSDDTLKIANVSDAQISPDGNWVVYTVSTVEGNVARSTLWLVRVNRPIASAIGRSSTPNPA